MYLGFYFQELELIRNLSEIMYQRIKGTWHTSPEECDGPCWCVREDECAVRCDCGIGLNEKDCLYQYESLQSCCSEAFVCGMLITIGNYDS